MIGVFDSGVGGLSVLSEIRKVLPYTDITYVADRGRAPYGPRSLDQVQTFSDQIARWLIDRGATTLVVACNTASAAALDQLRLSYPEVPIVGMEPAVKPAAANTTSGVIAVFATAATFQGRLFESVVSRFSEGARVITRACPDWVLQVESGVVSGEEVSRLVAAEVASAIAEGADTLVLGCTHFSFLKPTIVSVAGPEVEVIDPAPAVARQTARVAGDRVGSGLLTVAASGDLDECARLATTLAGMNPDNLIEFP